MHSDSEAGFTLIEVVIGLFLIVLLMAAVFGILSVSFKSTSLSDCKTELQQNARYAMDLMVREIQFAKKIHEVQDSCITFETNQVASGKITYILANENGIGILRRNQNDGSGAQPVTGGSSAIKVSVKQLLFITLRRNDLNEPLSVGISMEVIDVSQRDPVKQSSFELRTAVTGMNIPR